MTQSIESARKKWGRAAITAAILYTVVYVVLAFVTSSHIGLFGSITAVDRADRYEGSVDFDAL